MTLLLSEIDTLEAELPTPSQLHDEIPLLPEQRAFIQNSRDQIRAILNGWDSRILLILGPCSIHDPISAIEYGMHLKRLSEKIGDRFFLVMRAYLEKPRTILGWKGMLYDPTLDGSYLLAQGVRQSRKLLLELTEMEIPLGSELLEINTAPYYSDCLSWGCIGARTSASPPHRQLAASLDVPMGFKNSPDGNVDQAIHGILAASKPHVFLGLSPSGQIARVQAKGNKACHVILRGALDGPNYHKHAIESVIKKCQKAVIKTHLMVDCSHDNCGKDPLAQISVFKETFQQRLNGNRNIVGLMLESHLYRGAQEIQFPLRYGISVTDPCLDWNSTQNLILECYSESESTI